MSIIVEKEEGPLFDEDGKMSKSVLEIAEFMNQKLISETLTRQACKVIQDSGLLILGILPIQDRRKMGKKQILTGLSRVDEEKFKKLSDEELLHLNKVQGQPNICAFFSGEWSTNLINFSSKRTRKGNGTGLNWEVLFSQKNSYPILNT